MTRFLSDMLQATEPYFRQGLRRLESANGHPNTDIRFSTEVTGSTKAKLRELGLDPRDTTAGELYHALQERVKADDAKLLKKLRTQAALHVSAEGQIVDGMVYALQELPWSKSCFALKGSVLKSMIKKQPPKKAMKQLGYRSVASFLKHESPVTMLAAASLCEGEVWQRKLLDQYKRLKPGDFENRDIALVQPTSKRWHELAEQTVAEKKHNLLYFKELGAIVFLSLNGETPDGTTTTSVCLALHELNEIRAAGTFLKLCQVRPDFGKLVQTVATEEPHIQSELLQETFPWHLAQRYYANNSQADHGHVFEPHLQLEDMVWQPIEKALSQIEPSFNFWQDTSHLGLLHDAQPVSLNIVDAAVNFCNQLPFEQRLVHYFQRSLWHELLLRYLNHEAVEQAVARELQPEFAEEVALG